MYGRARAFDSGLIEEDTALFSCAGSAGASVHGDWELQDCRTRTVEQGFRLHQALRQNLHQALHHVVSGCAPGLASLCTAVHLVRIEEEWWPCSLFSAAEAFVCSGSSSLQQHQQQFAPCSRSSSSSSLQLTAAVCCRRFAAVETCSSSSVRVLFFLHSL